MEGLGDDSWAGRELDALKFLSLLFCTEIEPMLVGNELIKVSSPQGIEPERNGFGKSCKRIRTEVQQGRIFGEQAEVASLLTREHRRSNVECVGRIAN